MANANKKGSVDVSSYYDTNNDTAVYMVEHTFKESNDCLRSPLLDIISINKCLTLQYFESYNEK